MINQTSSVREDISRRSKRLLEQGFLLIDYETNGLPREPVQIAIITHEGSVIMNTLIQPDDIEAIEKKNLSGGRSASDIHGIKAWMVENASKFEDVYELIFMALDKNRVLAYNASFEEDVTNNKCYMLGLPQPQADWRCVMKAYAAFNGEWNNYRQNYQWHKLEDACSHEGIKFNSPAHNALTDTLMTLELVKVMANG